MGSNQFQVEVQLAVVDSPAPSPADVIRWARCALAALAPTEKRSLVVRIVGDDESGALNATYRAKQGATNVLSFPGPGASVGSGGPPLPLGDIVICAPQVVREAAEQNKSVSDHWAHLVIHGVLHLLNYSHERDDDRERMEAREVALLADLNIPNPYEQVGA